jgi:hypothetical protein
LPQDYREGSALDLAFKKQIDRIQERLHVEELAYGRSKAKGKEQGIALSAAPCEATQAL